MMVALKTLRDLEHSTNGLEVIEQVPEIISFPEEIKEEAIKLINAIAKDVGKKPSDFIDVDIDVESIVSLTVRQLIAAGQISIIMQFLNITEEDLK